MVGTFTRGFVALAVLVITAAAASAAPYRFTFPGTVTAVGRRCRVWRPWAKR